MLLSEIPVFQKDNEVNMKEGNSRLRLIIALGYYFFKTR